MSNGNQMPNLVPPATPMPSPPQAPGTEDSPTFQARPSSGMPGSPTWIARPTGAGTGTLPPQQGPVASPTTVMRGAASDVASTAVQGAAGVAQGAAGGALAGAAKTGAQFIGRNMGYGDWLFSEPIRNALGKYIPDSVKQEFNREVDDVSNYIGSIFSGAQQKQPPTTARNAPPEQTPQSAHLANIPQQYRQIILDAAQEFHLNPLMLAGVMTKESGGQFKFNPQAQGTSGERGLMQIMPNTWRGLTKGMDNPQGENFDLAFDPQTNIRMGAKYLSQLMKQYDDDENEALFHYNARNNTSAGQAYAQSVLQIMGKLTHDENVSAKGGTVTPMSPAMQQMPPPPAAPTDRRAASRSLDVQHSEEVEGPRAPAGVTQVETTVPKPKGPDMQKQMLIGGEAPKPLTTDVLQSVEQAAIALGRDPWTLLKAAAQGVATANPLYRAISGKQYPLGRTDPEQILQAGGRVAAGMLMGPEEGAAAETPAETAAAPARAQAPAAAAPAEEITLPPDIAAQRQAVEESETEVEGTRKAPADMTDEERQAERARLEKRLSEIYQETLREHQAEKAAGKTAAQGEDLTKQLKQSMPKKPRNFAPKTTKAKAAPTAPSP